MTAPDPTGTPPAEGATPPAGQTEAQPTETNEKLGEGGVKALAEERKARAEAERTAKQYKADSDELTKIRESQKTDTQKQADALSKAQREAADAVAEAARIRVALKYKLDETDIEFLGSGTPAEIEERAKRLAERVKGSASPDPKAPAGGKPNRVVGGTDGEAFNADQWLRDMAKSK